MVELSELLPFIVDMCKRLKHDPTQEERRLMKKILVPELGTFFDALEMGMPESETYDKIMYYLRLRESGELHLFDIQAQLPAEEQLLSKNKTQKDLVPMVASSHLNSSTNEISHKLVVEVTSHKHQYTVRVKNPNKEAFVAVRLFFANSINLKPRSSPEGMVMKDGTTLTATVPAQRQIIIGTLAPIDPTKPSQVVYSSATQVRRWAGITDEKESEAGVRTTHISKGLTALATPSNHGYEITIDNTTGQAHKLVVDFAASKNLKLRPEGDAVVNGTVVTVTVPPKTKIPVVEMIVSDDDLCSSQMHYTVKSLSAA